MISAWGLNPAFQVQPGIEEGQCRHGRLQAEVLESLEERGPRRLHTEEIGVPDVASSEVLLGEWPYWDTSVRTTRRRETAQ